MSPSMLWANPHALWLLAGILPLWILLEIFRKRRTATLRFSLTAPLRSAPRGLARLQWLPSALRLGALVLAVLALARPQVLGAKPRELDIEGIDIVVALDLSTSMEAADFQPKSRLFVAKEVLRQFLKGRTNDRIGLVVFAGEAYTQAPLTLDYSMLEQILDSVQTGQIEDGTAIGNALATSLNRLREGDARSKVVILITDGDNNAGVVSPMEAASMAADLKIRVYPILVGKGGLVPYPHGTDLFGRPAYAQVEIPVNPELLQSIATTTGGNFYSAVDKASLEHGLNDILDKLEKSKLHQAAAYENVLERFPLFLGWAAVLLGLELLLSMTRLRRFP